MQATGKMSMANVIARVDLLRLETKSHTLTEEGLSLMARAREDLQMSSSLSAAVACLTTLLEKQLSLVALSQATIEAKGHLEAAQSSLQSFTRRCACSDPYDHNAREIYPI